MQREFANILFWSVKNFIMNKNSTILILGCSGLVGHGIALDLIKNGYKVIGTSYKTQIVSKHKRLKIYNNLDLGVLKNYSKINKIIIDHKVKTIIHSSALVPNKNRYNIKNFYQRAMQINYLSFIELYKLSLLNGVKFLINISTPNVENIEYENLRKHHNFYIFTKYLAEKFLLSLNNKKMNLISLRIKSPYGYILNTKAVIPAFINKVIKKKEITLMGNVNNEHNFTFTEDIGSACRSIFKKSPNGIVNCIGKEKVSIKNLAKIIENIFYKKRKIFKNKKKIIKNNLNKLNTPLKDGLIKIISSNKKFLIFELKK